MGKKILEQALRKDLHIPDNKHMPRCSTLLAVGEMQIKTHPKTAKIEKAQSCLVSVNELEFSYVVGRSVNSKKKSLWKLVESSEASWASMTTPGYVSKRNECLFLTEECWW